MRVTDQRRARRAFTVLTAVTVLSTGALSAALAAPPGPATGLRVLGAGVLVAGCGFLAVRILLASAGSRRRPGAELSDPRRTVPESPRQSPRPGGGLRAEPRRRRNRDR